MTDNYSIKARLTTSMSTPCDRTARFTTCIIYVNRPIYQRRREEVGKVGQQAEAVLTQRTRG
jgi:hypothetical protein